MSCFCGDSECPSCGSLQGTLDEKKCEECGKETSVLTKDGLCFACLAKKHEEPDDSEGTWFNKG